MKIVECLCIICIAFLFVSNAYTQDTGISLMVENSTLKQMISRIEQESNYVFLISGDAVGELDKIVSLTVKNEHISNILEKAFENTYLSYLVTGRQVIVFKNEEKDKPVITTPIQQNIVITGTVRDNSGSPVSGVNVALKGTMGGVATGTDGRYSMLVPGRNAVLVFSFIGYITQEHTIGSRNELNVILDETIQEIEEVIIIGYVPQKKGTIIGSTVTMNIKENMRELPVTDFGSILTGQLSGVNISTPEGVPGSHPDILVRIQSSWNHQPVTYVIDGIICSGEDFNSLSPNEVETVTVLKDAASAAIYGSRSSGGVILVTTKKGKSGKPVFDYMYSYGWDSRTKNVNLTNAVQTGELYNRINGEADPAGWKWSQEELDYYRTVNNSWGYDQLKAVWRTPNIQSHNLSIAGGTTKLRYFTGLSYTNRNGFLKPLTYEKINFRLNMTVDITKHVQFQVISGMTVNNRGQLTFEGNSQLYSKLLKWQPDQPVYTDSGQLVDYGWIANVGGEADGAGGYRKNQYLKPQLALNMDIKIPFIEGLNIRAAYSNSWAILINREFGKNYDMVTLKKDGANRHIVRTADEYIIGIRKSTYYSKEFLYKGVDWGHDYQLNFQLNYQRMFDNRHQVQGALVFEKSRFSRASVAGRRENFPVYQTDQFWAASSAGADTWGNGSADWVSGRISYIGQLNYAYADKYLLNFSFREDGSMNFASRERWGFFPAGSIGWMISEERFFRKDWVSLLKIRLSMGLTGNDSVGGWQWQESYRNGRSAYLGALPSIDQGITYGPVVNPSLTWEKSLSYNAGVDLTLLKKWNTSIDYWFRKSYDILGPRNASVPTSFSMEMPDENYGKVNAQGIDFSIGYKNNTGNFEYYGSLTASYGWNKVIEKDYAENAQWIDIPVGKSMSYISGYRYSRIIRTQEQLEQFNRENPDYTINGQPAGLGMMLYKDIGGPEGVPDRIVDSWDRDLLRSGNFPVIYGLNLGGIWKGLSIDVMFNGKINDVKSFRNLADGVEWNRMWTEWYDNSWSPETPDAWLPRRINSDLPKTYTEGSDFWLKNISFMRLKYLSIGYTIPAKFYNKVLDDIRLFFSGTNLFVLSNFTYYDPEIATGIDFPIIRTFSFGINVKF